MTALLLSVALATTTDVYSGEDLFGVLDSLQAGDEVIVHDGTWSTQQGGGSWFRSYDWQGDAANPIIVRTAPGALVVLEGDPAGSQNTLNLAGQYFTFSGFELVNGSHGLRMFGSAHAVLEDLHIHHTADVGLSMNVPGETYEDMVVRGTHIHDTSGTGECMYLGCNDDGCQVFDSVIEWNWCHDTLTASQGDGIELKTGSYNTIVRHNVIHDVKYPGITLYGAMGRGDNTVEGNIVWNSGDNGIQVVGEVTVRNNVVVNSGNNGIQVKASQGEDPHGLTIVHNTVDGAGDACFRGNDFHAGTDGIVSNNVFHCPGANAIRLPAGTGALAFARNAVNGTDEGPAGNIAVDASAWTGLLDTYPVAGSVLIDAGMAEPSVTDDFNCLPRTGVPDIGAYDVSDPTNPGWSPAPGFKTCAGTPPTTGTGTGTGGAGTGTGTGAGGTATGTATGAPVDDSGEASDPKGCGCNSAPTPAGALALLALLGVTRRSPPKGAPFGLRLGPVLSGAQVRERHDPQVQR